jgi:hypothetical protein
MKTSREIQLIIEYKWCIYFSYTIFSLLFSHFLLFCSLPCSFSTLLNDNNIERTNHTVVFCYYSFTLYTTWIYRYNFIVLKSIQFRCDIHCMYAFFYSAYTLENEEDREGAIERWILPLFQCILYIGICIHYILATYAFQLIEIEWKYRYDVRYSDKF